MRIIFMGTPAFAVPSLRCLHEVSPQHNWQVVAVVTQPDRPAGRSRKRLPSPVKVAAQAADIPVLQPRSFRKDPAAVEALQEFSADLVVVAAYGLILPKNVLEVPTYGCVNVHASLLPAYRGASPITAAILDGQTHTGNSIMLMDEGMDTGPVLAQEQHPIRADDTTASLSERLATAGAKLLCDTLPGWLAGNIAPIPQEELPGEASVCRLIKKEDGRIDWTQPAVHIERMTRAYNPWPSAYTTWRDAPFKIWRAEVYEGKAEPGVVVEAGAGPAVGTGSALLRLQEVQPAGKRVMDIASFLNGAPDFIGSRLGNEEETKAGCGRPAHATEDEQNC